MLLFHYFIISQHNMTCLHWAAGRGHLEIVDLLLSNDAKVDSTDKVCYTYTYITYICYIHILHTYVIYIYCIHILYTYTAYIYYIIYCIHLLYHILHTYIIIIETLCCSISPVIPLMQLAVELLLYCCITALSCLTAL